MPIGHVSIAGAIVDLADVRESPETHVDLFRRARGERAPARCLCADPAARLVIRARGEKFHLARWPGDADAHDPDCVFTRTPASLSGRAAYAPGVVIEEDAGVRLRLGLSMTGVVVAAGDPTPGAPGTPGGRRNVSLLGLLHYLWESAGLNTWRPGPPRRWSDCASRLRHEVTDVVVDGDPLSRHLFLAARGTPAERWRRFADVLGGPRHRLGLVLAELDAITPRAYSVQWRLHECREAVVYATEDLTARLRRSYRAPTPRLDGPPGERVRVVGLFAVTRQRRSRGAYVRLHDAALMPCTTDYVPVDSRHELAMAAALRESRRRFTKPLRFDATRDVVLPDFVLTDEDPPRYVEVYGMTGHPGYDARVRVKRAHYAATRQPLIEWDPSVASEPTVPAAPP